jgi:hypothetical protein
MIDLRWKGLSLMKPIFLIFLVWMFFSLPIPGDTLYAENLYAQNLQQVLPLDSEAERLAGVLLLFQGRARPFASSPRPQGELLCEVNRIDEDALPPAGIAAYRRLRELIAGRFGQGSPVQRACWPIGTGSAGLYAPEKPETLLASTEPAKERALVFRQEKGLIFTIRPELSIEGYLQTRGNETEWEYPFEKRRPLVSLPLELWVGNHIYGLLDLSIRKINPVFPGVEDTVEPFPYSNLPTDIRTIDGNLPFRAFLAFGSDSWEAQFGRDRISWGNGRTGNLILGDNPLFYNVLRFTLRGQFLKFSTLWANMESYTPTGNGGNLETGGGAVPRVERNLLGHRLEVRLWDRINVGLTEAVVIATPSMEMKYLNPLMIYHSWYLEETKLNIIASLEAEAVVIPGLSLYLQAAVNQFTLPMEVGKEYAKGEPDAYGFIAGVENVQALGPGFLTAGIEGALTSPWLYIHRTYQTQFFYTQMIMAENVGHRVIVEKPLGYPTGPDTLAFSITADYWVPLQYRFTGAFLLQWRGRNSFASPSELFIPAADPNPIPGSRDWRTPSGSYPEMKIVLRLGGEYWPSRKDNLSLGADLYFIARENRNAMQSPREYNLQAVFRVKVAL